MTILKNSKADVIENQLNMVDKPLKLAVFANDAARDAAIPVPEDGMIIVNLVPLSIQLRINNAWATMAKV